MITKDTKGDKEHEERSILMINQIFRWSKSREAREAKAQIREYVKPIGGKDIAVEITTEIQNSER